MDTRIPVCVCIILFAVCVCAPVFPCVCVCMPQACVTSKHSKTVGQSQFQVAAYDFIMPVVINHLGAPSPAPTPFPPTPAPSNRNSIQHIVNPRPQPFTVATPRKHVIATALRQPLQLSHTKVEFCLPVNFHEMAKNTGVGATSVRTCFTLLHFVSL